ncbi:uncharacterized protein zgc:193726 isoform X4 [Perca fluviatilis]|uniref:uncharacterized protein zgc:193726 isoform X4 n=1 Tax=Perca fluviatilis TaxID=8168 RepID=UPI001966725A|nr:uncharacterized protein zgc:193726 isoform X4 [Perca fluviatilis]
MMKAVQSAALSLMMMMMMMVSAGPLPASFDRHDDLNADTSHLLKIREENSTSRFESRQHVNNTEDDARFESRQHVNNTEDDTRDVSSNNTVDNMAASTFQDLSLGVIKIRCALSTCLTANLAASLQGGEETAGGATTDPFGIGKK